MNKDGANGSSAVDVAYNFIDEAGTEWTRDQLWRELLLAGFRVEDDVELDCIVEAVQERQELENLMSEATNLFLRQNGYRDLRDASERIDCSIEEVLEYIAMRVNLLGHMN